MAVNLLDEKLLLVSVTTVPNVAFVKTPEVTICDTDLRALKYGVATDVPVPPEDVPSGVVSVTAPAILAVVPT